LLASPKQTAIADRVAIEQRDDAVQELRAQTWVERLSVAPDEIKLVVTQGERHGIPRELKLRWRPLMND
jgi:hypothetical protein